MRVRTQLKDIVSFSKGKQINGEELLVSGKYDYLNGGVLPSGKWNEYNTAGETVTISEGGNSCGFVNFMEKPFWCGAHCYYLFEPKINAKYLYYALKSKQSNLMKIRSGACMPNIKKNDLGKFKIVYDTDSNEQFKTIKVLDTVSLMIVACQKQLQKLDELVKSRFIEMFGDPVTNLKGWTTKPLLDMGNCKNGMNFHTGDSGMEMHCLGVGDFKDLSFIDGTDHLPVISLNEAPPEESMLRDGDIVFVRSNGNKALVGRCLVVYPRNTPTTYSGFCIRYRLTSSEVDTTYLLRVLKTDSMRKKMAGRGANIQNLNQQILSALDIPLPPIKLQQAFAAFVEQVDKSEIAVQQALDKAQLLFDSLMQKYFG